ncbi:MAG: D-tyrosyl-tRNA(Tyr) deacylase [Acidimicrobiia bacterium]|nr:D-tyrosyl-tRNA(Tyr) deacylase [Acidimicrobiia bacterium]
MRVVLQRVSSAEVRVGADVVGSIGRGYLALVGVATGDTDATARAAAAKVAAIRLFPSIDEPDRRPIDTDLTAAGGAVLAVSQFTLLADTRHGRRPSFSDAAPPAIASGVFDTFVATLGQKGIAVHTGEFGAHMQVELVNDGPVTIVLDFEGERVT